MTQFKICRFVMPVYLDCLPKRCIKAFDLKKNKQKMLLSENFSSNDEKQKCYLSLSHDVQCERVIHHQNIASNSENCCMINVKLKLFFRPKHS